MNYKVGIVSLGCAKNQVDAEMLLYTLKNRGFIIVNDPADADAVIVNTCGYILKVGLKPDRMGKFM